MTKICVVTGTRAEYGLLRWVIDDIHNSKELNLQLVVTGSHLSSEFGFTKNEIVEDGYPISRDVEMLLSSDSKVGMAKSTGLGVIGMTDALTALKPDLIVLLGDRYEIFAAATAAFFLNIPILHLHGGERTDGAIDDVFRHCITKMSSIHCVAAEQYKRRVVQLGETDTSIHIVGALGLDNIEKLQLLSRNELETALCLDLSGEWILVTHHPETSIQDGDLVTMKNLCAALSDFEDKKIMFTFPNSDANGRLFRSIVIEHCNVNSNSHCLISLGQLKYLSFLKEAKVVVGNSSSGIIEAPSLNTATVNIGARQDGRIKSTSVIDCGKTKEEMIQSISRAMSTEFQRAVLNSKNPYGQPGAHKRVMNVIGTALKSPIVRSTFVDMGGLNA